MRTPTPLMLSVLLAMASLAHGQPSPPRPAPPPAGSGHYVAVGCISKQGTASAPRYVVTDPRGDKPVAWRLQGDSELLEEINEGLATAIEDGTYAKIYEKWFKHAPPNSIETATHEAT